MPTYSVEQVTILLCYTLKLKQTNSGVLSNPSCHTEVGKKR